MLEFKKEIINGSFNRIKKSGVDVDCVNVNIKSKDKNIDIRLAGKGILATGIVAIAPTAICVLGGTIAICVITKAITKRKQSKI
jgi:hypothetical protein